MNIRQQVSQYYEIPPEVTDEDLSQIPIVLNIKGTKDNPQHDVYVGRQCYMGGWKLNKSKWHNPYGPKYGDQAISLFVEYFNKQEELIKALPELKGKKIGCWCIPKPCHATTLQNMYIIHVLGCKPKFSS